MRKIFFWFKKHAQLIYKSFLFAIAAVIILAILPKERQFEYEFRLGKPWLHEDLIAPFDFPILKNKEELDTERKQIKDAHQPYFRYDKEQTQLCYVQYRKTFDEEWRENQKSDPRKDLRAKRNYDKGLVILDTLMRRGIIEMHESLEGRQKEDHINLIEDNTSRNLPLTSFFTIKSADTYIRKQLRRSPSLDTSMLRWVIEDVMVRNVVFDPKTNETILNAALEDISSAHGLIQKGEKIISRGEVVTRDKFQELSSLKADYEGQISATATIAKIVGGQAVLVVMLLLILFFMLKQLDKTIFQQNKLIVLILLLIILELSMFSLIMKIEPSSLYLIPVCLLAVIIRAFFRMRLSIVVYLITVLMMAFQAPNSFEFLFLQLLAGMFVLLSMANIHKRGQFFVTSVYIFFTYALVYSAFILIQGREFSEIRINNYMFFAISAIFTFSAYPLIFVFEKAFGLITDVTLLELSNTNTPLLRALAQKAPGTFQHSLSVAILAEEAAFAIGANALLVRTGAYYHDIGKMHMPAYFTENQKGSYNPHDDLSYIESAKIIVSHVIKGIETAKKENIPEQIIDFIRTHHGTRRADYFYILHKKEMHGEEIDAKPFTYPGPAPFSKETALLMMSDSVEAASRSLKEPDEQKINDLVENVVGKQMETGQFNNANITLREISLVKKILKKKLMNIYHVRIEYPKE